MSFEKCIEELQAFKAKHGHVRVTVKHDTRFYEFCVNMRSARRNPGTGMTITDDRIKALDELGFTWEGKRKSFEKRIEELQAFKAKHGHVRVALNHDKRLYDFCGNMRYARRNPGTGMTITEDRINALDELGFEWGGKTLGFACGKKKSFEERIEELQAFKEKYGHVRVTEKHDKSLANFCKNMRGARRGTKPGKVITEDRIKALDELGFTWGDKLKSFEDRIEELEAFKKKNGHVRVTAKHDKSLALFCRDMRAARRGTRTGAVITEDRIKALDELGFTW